MTYQVLMPASSAVFITEVERVPDHPTGKGRGWRGKSLQLSWWGRIGPQPYRLRTSTHWASLWQVWVPKEFNLRRIVNWLSLRQRNLNFACFGGEYLNSLQNGFHKSISLSICSVEVIGFILEKLGYLELVGPLLE